MRKLIKIFILFLLLIIIKETNRYGGCSNYGIMATETYDGYCKCISGYIMGSLLGKPYCISGTTYCYNNYGYNSEYDYFSNSCKCSSGYDWGLDILGKKSCISVDTLCQNDYGYGAKSTGNGYCGCKYGYIMKPNSLGKNQCLYGSTYCSSNYGIYSTFDDYTKSCKCNDGYILKPDSLGNNTCQKKENNVYFYLQDVNENNREIVIKDLYNYNIYYHITYGYGCYSIDKYLSKNIVLNLGTDFIVDRWDKIVLQDNNETCDIQSKEKVNSNYRVSCPDTINGYLEGGQCYCNEGYKFDTTSNSCELKDITTEDIINVNYKIWNTKFKMTGNTTIGDLYSKIYKKYNGLVKKKRNATIDYYNKIISLIRDIQTNYYNKRKWDYLYNLLENDKI